MAEANLQEAFLPGTHLAGANLQRANLTRANLADADLTGTHLEEAVLFGTNLFQARLGGSLLVGAKLIRVNLTEAQLPHADLFFRDLREGNLTRANLGAANLQRVRLVETNLQGADLSSCRIYGISAWNVHLKGAIQSDLIITRDDEAAVHVDDLEVAQFIYMLLDNRKIRQVIDTVTSKAVLILGRFTSARKPILESIRDALRDRGYVPILFDFTPSPNRDLTETIQLLANMSKFVVADLTEAKSIPQELSHIIPSLPNVPIQPILLASEREYAMFEHWRGFRSVLPAFPYQDGADLIQNLDAKVIAPIEKWRAEQDEVLALKKKIEELEAELARRP